MDVTHLKKFDKDAMKKTAEVPVARGGEIFDRFVQWLVFKPQLHAVTPFETNVATRNYRYRESNPDPRCERPLS
jgi:hypothetical protein